MSVCYNIFGCRMQFIRVEETVLVRNIYYLVKILNFSSVYSFLLLLMMAKKLAKTYTYQINFAY